MGSIVDARRPKLPIIWKTTLEIPRFAVPDEARVFATERWMGAPVLAGLLGRSIAPDIQAGWSEMLIAGLLVGAGTRYASGCTSGHGVCGLSRLSPRSLVATLSFMAAGFITVFVVRHAIGA